MILFLDNELNHKKAIYKWYLKLLFIRLEYVTIISTFIFIHRSKQFLFIMTSTNKD